MKKVVERLLSDGALSCPDDLGDRSVSTSAVQRILRRLAALSLARNAGGRWIPSPILMHAPLLYRCG